MKTIYYDKNLRCKIKYVRYMNHFDLKVQKRIFFIFWRMVNRPFQLSEGFWGENWGIGVNPMVIRFQFGGSHEAWKTGTLNIVERVTDLFLDYLNDLDIKNETEKKLQGI